MFFTASSPIVVDGLCIAQLGGQSDGAVVACDLASGAEKWKWTGDGTAYASPALLSVDGLKAIVAETDKRIVAVGLADGKLLWEAPFDPGRGPGRYNSVTPIIDGQTLIYGGPRRGMTAVKFEKQGDKLAAKELWSNADAVLQYNTPALKNGLLFALSDRDTLFCLSAETGKTAWTAAAPLAGNRGYGSVVDAGAVLFALTPAGELVVYEPSDKEFKELAKYKVAEGATYGYPIVAGNRVFVKDKDSVALWAID
jgi:outer membrane protein assembly factor BamB